MATPEEPVAPMSRRLPGEDAARTGKASSEERVESPRASSSLGPDDTSGLKASVLGTGLVYWLGGGGVPVPRGRATNPPGGGGASRAPVAGRDANGLEAGRGVKGSDPGGEENWLEGPLEPAGSGDATRGGPKPGTAAEIADG